MNYVAHKRENDIQTNKEHLQGTAELAGKFAGKFGKAEWGYCGGMLHDIGKYSKEFQHKIQNSTNEYVDHSTAGAKLCNELGGYYSVLAYCIAGHHAGLPDYGNSGISSSLCGRMNKKIYDYQAYKDEIEIPMLSTVPIEIKINQNMDFALATFIRMLYSCLVDADYLDTEFFMNAGNTGRMVGESMECLLGKLEQHISKWLQNEDPETVNGHRTEILKHCLKQSQEKQGFFKLTVPTGGGKTIASLAFALKHAVKHKMDRVIYVIPYTSIIEQNAQVFRDILGAENVLEHHYNMEFKDSEEFHPLKLASENWDLPIIVTTNVQFFESLFANKSSKCRKIHNIANSVVILDEAQMLPLDYLKPCIAMLQELVESYRTSIVLCSATQPALEPFFSNETDFTELCPNVQKQFLFFERVTYKKIGTITIEHLCENLKSEKRALCILNTKKLAQSVYKAVEEDGVYHLSTSMYPKHRKEVLEEIRTRLAKKEKCIVVSTSLVEAGVDLDFDCVYRQIAGMDSMIQAAGRCNREGEKKAAESNVYLFDLEDTNVVSSQKLQISVARGILSDYENIAELESISDYFFRLYHYRGMSLDKKNIMREFHDFEYNFSKVAKEFRLIEQKTKTIFVPIEPEAEKLLQELKQKGISKERLRKMGQYCIQVYANKNAGNSFFEKLYNAGMIAPISEDIHDYYELIAKEQYVKEYGLNMFIDDKMAIFM